MEHFDIAGNRIFASGIFWTRSNGVHHDIRDPIEELRESAPWFGYHELPIDEIAVPILCIKRPDGSNVLTVTRLDA